MLGLNNGGTGQALGTSGSDAIMFYDVSAGGVRYLYPGTGITITGTTISATGGGGGSGTVTSVGLTAPTGLTVSGSPVTGAGSLGLSWSGGYQAYTSSEASKLAGIAAGAQVNAVNNVNGQTGNVTITYMEDFIS